MNEGKIVSACIKSRKAWETIKEHATLSEFGADTATLLGLVGEYYVRDSAASIVDVDILAELIGRSIQNPKHISLLQNALRNLPESSPENVAHEVLEVKRHNAALKLSSALLHGSKDLKKLLEEYQTISNSTDLLTGSASSEEEIVEKFLVKDLVEKSFDPKQLIPIWPKALNDFLEGGVRPGHHVLVFAPTEMGKTLLLINMLAGWVKAKYKVLYVGNEDPVADLQIRYISRLTHLNKQAILKDPEAAQKILEKRGYEHVVFAPLAPGNFTTIQRLVDRYSPKVVVLDQLRNIDVDSDHRTQALEKAATEARNLAKRNGIVVVSVTQAADSATGKRILARGDVDGSNIGIPGQVDLMVGLGATDDDEQKNVRTLSFPKNKVSGKHQHFSIEIDPQLSMVVEHG